MDRIIRHREFSGTFRHIIGGLTLCCVGLAAVRLGMNGERREWIYLLLWLVGVASGVVASGGKGWRCAIYTSFASGVVALPYAVTLVPSNPNYPHAREPMKHAIGEALPIAVPGFASIGVAMMVGLIIGALILWVIERRKGVKPALWAIGAGLSGIGAIAWATHGASVQSSSARYAAPPLGVAEYRQYESIKLPDDSEAAADASEGHTLVRDISFGPYGRSNTLDLYMPSLAGRLAPVLIYIHGGGWLSGSSEDLPKNWLMPLLRRGLAVASINYRLVPSAEKPPGTVSAAFPAQIQDCFAAVRFLRASASKYRLDAEAIGVMGHSAGGHLAALVALAGNVREFNNDGLNTNVSNRVQAAVLLAAPTDLRVMDRQLESHLRAINSVQANFMIPPDTFNVPTGIEYMLGNSLHATWDLATQASPASHASASAPPMLIVNGFRDIAVPPEQAEYLYCELRRAGAKAELMLVPGVGHDLAQTPAVGNAAAEFLSLHLHH